MATLTICVVLVAGMLCVSSQPAPPLQTDDLPVSGGKDDPRKNDAVSPDILLFDRLDNETDPRRSEGERYTWEHDLGTGETVSERAFAANGSNVIVVKSKDRALDAYNITRSTSVYAFSDLTSLVAVIPWRRSGPCLIRNTSLTYQTALDLLTARNGSRIQTLSRILVDGNVAPLSTEEKTTFLTTNPQLRRACGLKQIVVTTDLGDNQAPFSNSTEQIVTFSLEAEVSITVPERPDLPDTSKNGGGKRRSGNRWGARTR